MPNLKGIRLNSKNEEGNKEYELIVYGTQGFAVGKLKNGDLTQSGELENFLIYRRALSSNYLYTKSISKIFL
jgi:hypothetical protein